VLNRPYFADGQVHILQASKSFTLYVSSSTETTLQMSAYTA
jgi:hypothetical protein